MTLHIDASDRKAYAAAHDAVVKFGSVDRALTHYGSKKDPEKAARGENTRLHIGNKVAAQKARS